ncbi:MAG: hypothetical protein QOD03_717 [Verrucomicrobiota bacterium]|jgi:hypothetical protein
MAGLFLLAVSSIPTFYPAAVPVTGTDGIPLLKPDGSPVTHRDLAEFYRYNTPAFSFLAAGFCLFVWWLIRAVRFLYGRKGSTKY